MHCRLIADKDIILPNLLLSIPFMYRMLMADKDIILLNFIPLIPTHVLYSFVPWVGGRKQGNPMHKPEAQNWRTLVLLIFCVRDRKHRLWPLHMVLHFSPFLWTHRLINYHEIRKPQTMDPHKRRVLHEYLTYYICPNIEVYPDMDLY